MRELANVHLSDNNNYRCDSWSIHSQLFDSLDPSSPQYRQSPLLASYCVVPWSNSSVGLVGYQILRPSVLYRPEACFQGEKNKRSSIFKKVFTASMMENLFPGPLHWFVDHHRLQLQLFYSVEQKQPVQTPMGCFLEDCNNDDGRIRL